MRHVGSLSVGAFSRAFTSMVNATTLKGNIRPSATQSSSEYDIGKCDYKVLLLKRNAKSTFMNAYVFPGGNLDESDQRPDWKSILGDGDPLLPWKVCAVRETFEEAGILLLDKQEDYHANLDSADMSKLRSDVHAHADTLLDYCQQTKSKPLTADLVHFSQWVTPFIEPRRYNTHFFLANLPKPPALPHNDTQVHIPTPDGKEVLDLRWLRPEEALQLYATGNITLFPPQWYSLYALSLVKRQEDLKDLAGVGAFRSRKSVSNNGVVTICPYFMPADQVGEPGKDLWPPLDAATPNPPTFNFCSALPGDHLYPIQGQPKDSVTKPRHRLWLERGKRGISQIYVERTVDVEEAMGAKLTLASAVVFTVATVYGVHYLQMQERENMHLGIQKDNERRSQKLKQQEQNMLELQQQQALQKQLESTQKVTPSS
ncbi:hypothetical protein BZG36_01664 [Bifiguratus adelaidae]|uniref:Nudix hydrolase domain-containing protein n=1 Tax=Bifiguratus adelaidae TaxID=1938954 RepID=A0A261Y4D0_9FUNG|nr:hypothetical protein BZG36_01664 [Bifiguratus adelaidae]